jgi:hypothetical protein
MRFKRFEDFNGTIFHNMDNGTTYRWQEIMVIIDGLAFDGPQGPQISKGAARRLRKLISADGNEINEIIEIPDQNL